MQWKLYSLQITVHNFLDFSTKIVRILFSVRNGALLCLQVFYSFCFESALPSSQVTFLKPGHHLGSSFTQARTNFWTDKNLRNRHVSGFTLVPRLRWEYWQQSMRRGGHLEYSIHGKEPGSILLLHRINKYPGLVSTLESAFKTLQVRMLDSPDTCGRKAYPERKSCGLKNIWIRVEGV